MVRIQFTIDLHYELGFQGADFVFNIHAAKTASQTIVNEQLVISQQVPHTIQTDQATCTRYLRLTGAPGPLQEPRDASQNGWGRRQLGLR